MSPKTRHFSYLSKINLLFFGIIALMIVIGIITLRITQSLVSSGDKVFHSQELLRATGEVLSSAQDIESGARGYVITGDSSFLEPYVNASNAINENIKHLRALVTTSPSQTEIVDTLQKLIDLRIIAATHSIETRRDSASVLSNKLAIFQNGKYLMDQIRKLTKTIEDEETTSLQQLKEANVQHGRSFKIAFSVLLIGVFVTLLVVFILIKRNSVFRNNAEILLKQNLDEISNFKTLFESAPGLYLTLLPDLTIEAVSDEYLAATMTTREGIIGKKLFDVFPDNPDDPEADGTSNLRASLSTVLRTKQTHRMAIQKYDIQNPDGTFVVRYWSPLNKPVINKYNEVVFLIHSVEDVTIKLQQETALKNSVKEISDYKFALDQAALVAITDQLGIIKYVNDKLCEASQFRRDELIGQDLRILSSGYQSGAVDKLWNTIAEGKLWKGELKNQAKDGTEYWVDATLIPFLNNDGTPFQYVAIKFDITRQMQQQELLKQQKEEMNVQQEELEKANAELEAQTTNLLASEEELRVQQEELMETNRQLEEKGQLLEETNRTVNNKNEKLHLLSEQLRHKAEELALSSKYKSEFLANMSHELRTPLNSILLLSKLLEENEDKILSKEQVEFASVIYKSGKGLLELINDILDLSKIESGKMEIDVEDITAAAICNDMNDTFKPLAISKGLTFRILPEEGERETILKTDRIRIEQVLKNFLSNAFKFTEKGSIDLIVRKPDSQECAHLAIEQEYFMCFEVKDTGIGIPQEKHALVFEAFQQADGSTRRKYGGTGLGLSISREIARILGGEILMTSNPGTGSEFKLVVPRDVTTPSYVLHQTISDTPDVRNENKRINALHAIIDKNIVTSIPQNIPDDRYLLNDHDKAILIVEDDTTFAYALIKHIHERGYKALVAVSGGDALALAIMHNPIGILLDIRLPVKSGWTVMKELKENPSTKHIPVYIMSCADINSKDTIRAGAINFMSKNNAGEELNKALDRIEQIRGKTPKKVLLVDINEIHTSAISSFIGNKEIHCISAKTAKQACEILKTEAVDCLVLDMGLPDLNGYELLETIKLDKAMENIPVIIYTGQSISLAEERKLKQYAESIILRTAESFQRLASEVSLFLHQVDTVPAKTAAKTLYIKDRILTNKHILIVDDDARNIFALTQLLESQQMKVSAACDGFDALEALKNNPDISLVLMDMMMPHKDGYETIWEIRKDQKFQSLPIIAVTAKAMLGDREKCINAGANDYVTKPVDGDLLISLLRVWLYK